MHSIRSKKTADAWFAEYGACHQDGVNKALHWICIPLIVASLIGLLWAAPTPSFVTQSLPWFNWAWVVIALAMVFYIRLSPPLAVGMALFTAAAVGAIVLYQQMDVGPVWIASLAIFIAAWIGQFVGHKIEGEKPAFFDDLKFLLIGPLWLLGSIYRRLGIRY